MLALEAGTSLLEYIWRVRVLVRIQLLIRMHRGKPSSSERLKVLLKAPNLCRYGGMVYTADLSPAAAMHESSNLSIGTKIFTLLKHIW